MLILLSSLLTSPLYSSPPSLIHLIRTCQVKLLHILTQTTWQPTEYAASSIWNTSSVFRCPNTAHPWMLFRCTVLYKIFSPLWLEMISFLTWTYISFCYSSKHSTISTLFVWLSIFSLLCGSLEGVETSCGLFLHVPLSFTGSVQTYNQVNKKRKKWMGGQKDRSMGRQKK